MLAKSGEDTIMSISQRGENVPWEGLQADPLWHEKEILELLFMCVYYII